MRHRARVLHSEPKRAHTQHTSRFTRLGGHRIVIHAYFTIRGAERQRARPSMKRRARRRTRKRVNPIHRAHASVAINFRRTHRTRVKTNHTRGPARAPIHARRSAIRFPTSDVRRARLRPAAPVDKHHAPAIGSEHEFALIRRHARRTFTVIEREHALELDVTGDVAVQRSSARSRSKRVRLALLRHRARARHHALFDVTQGGARIRW
mmetsp:Transcript_3834/g.12901  ORF Transcript_3834/g.12901 Transcript_3834/m.12901 type:complete len:208 (-) Transcript_3834:437-1060(-)